MTTRTTPATVGQSATSESDSAYIPGPTEPLMPQQEKMPKIIDDKEVDGAVYKSTIDQVQIKQAPKYIGLSKEELEYYANDPSWKKIRWVCLLLFWLAWIVMFLAAILIVVSSPKCPPKPPREWFQKKLCYQIWTRSFQDSNGDGVGDLVGLASRVEQVAQNKILAIWPVPLLYSNSSSGYDVKDHKKIDPQLGTSEDFDNLVAAVHKNEMKFIMDLPLTTVSLDHPWFEKSQNREGNYLEYFRWKSAAPADQKNWALNSVRNEYYYNWHLGKRYPILNWDTKEVRDEMKSIIKYWIDRKVDGFYFGGVDHMSINENDGTPNWDKIHEYLKEINDYARNLTQSQNLLTFTSFDLQNPDIKNSINELKLQLKIKGQLDYVINTELVSVNQSCNARCIHQHLDTVNQFHSDNNSTWPMWEIGQPYQSRIATRMGSIEKAELMIMLLMSLPGSINTYYGDEIGMVDSENVSKKNFAPRAPMQWTAGDNAGFSKVHETGLPIPVNKDYKEKNYDAQNGNGKTTMKMFRRLAGLRGSEEAFLYGNMTLGPAHDDILLVFANSNTGTASFLTILNFGNSTSGTINLRAAPFDQLPLDGFDITAVIGTTKLGKREIYSERKAVDVTKLDLMANEGIVLRMKPKK